LARLQFILLNIITILTEVKFSLKKPSGNYLYGQIDSPFIEKIITYNDGTVRNKNKSGKGVSVYLHLPLQNSPDYYKN
jgi:hypothetical protein